jgi:hypothetical protein
MHKNRVRKRTAATIIPKKTVGQSNQFCYLKPFRKRLLDFATNITSKINKDNANSHQTPIIEKMKARINGKEYEAVLFLFMGCLGISYINGLVTSFNECCF